MGITGGDKGGRGRPGKVVGTVQEGREGLSVEGPVTERGSGPSAHIGQGRSGQSSRARS